MTFGVPLFLLAALAGAIPVVMHMINRQNAPVMQFSTLRFLQLSVQKTRRRKYVTDLTLLLLRVAALVLIAIALARPAMHRFHGLLGGGGSTAVVLIIDNSGSMTTTDRDGLRWQRAQEAARQVLRQLTDGDEIGLLVTNGTPPLASDQLFRNHEVVRQALAATRTGFGRANLDASLQLAQRLLEQSTLANHEICVITDMRANCWQLDAVKPRVPDDETVLLLIDVSGTLLANTGLVDLEVKAVAPVAGMPLRIKVKVAGDSPITQQRRLQLLVDGKPKDTSPMLEIEPGQTVSHQFSMTLEEAGIHAGQIRLAAEDACPADDAVYFAAHINPAFSVAVVKSPDHEIPYLDQAYYLQQALTPADKSASGVRVRRLTPTALTREPFSKFAVLFCVNLTVPDETVGSWLVSYVRSGGNLVWVSGDQLDPIAYSALDEKLDGQLLPIRLTGISGAMDRASSGCRIGFLDPDSPIVAPFIEPASLYQSVQVHRYVTLPPISGSNVRVLARLDNGEPLLVQRTIEAGAIYFWASSFHTDWTNLPLRPLFLPFLSNLTFQLAGSHAVQSTLIAGDTWVFPVLGDDSCAVQVRQPNNDLFRVEFQPGDDRRVRFGNTDQVGVYQAEIRHSTHASDVAFAVNPDPDEYSARAVSREALKSQLGFSKIVYCSDPLQTGQAIQRLRHGQGLWQGFLILVLAALITEAYLSNRKAVARNADRSLQTSQARFSMATQEPEFSRR